MKVKYEHYWHCQSCPIKQDQHCQCNSGWEVKSGFFLGIKGINDSLFSEKYCDKSTRNKRSTFIS